LHTSHHADGHPIDMIASHANQPSSDVYEINVSGSLYRVPFREQDVSKVEEMVGWDVKVERVEEGTSRALACFWRCRLAEGGVRCLQHQQKQKSLNLVQALCLLKRCTSDLGEAGGEALQKGFAAIAEPRSQLLESFEAGAYGCKSLCTVQTPRKFVMDPPRWEVGERWSMANRELYL
jgi:hypothetical protein